jgi:urease accessory protein
VADADSLRRFLGASVRQAGFGVIPFVTESYASSARFEELDAIADAFLTNAVANRASRIQGRTLAATAARVWPSEALDTFEARTRRSHAHVGPVSGAAFRLVGLPLATAQKAILYGTARGVLSAAIRLGIVGSYEAQRLQHACGPELSATWARCASLSVEDLAQTVPVIDLLQAGHDRLYSRLFQS